MFFCLAPPLSLGVRPLKNPRIFSNDFELFDNIKSYINAFFYICRPFVYKWTNVTFMRFYIFLPSSTMHYLLIIYLYFEDGSLQFVE